MEEKKAKNILVISGVLDKGNVSCSIEIIKDLISLGHNVTCYALDQYEEMLKKTGVKLKTIKIDKSDFKNLPPLLAEKIIYSLKISRFYEGIINDALKSEEKYDFLLVDSFFDGNELNKIIKSPTVISLYFVPIGEKSPFIELARQKRMESLIPINKKYNLNIRDFISLQFIADSKYKLMFTSKLFNFESNVLDDSFLFIGPCIEEYKPDESFNFIKDENKKLIYISLVPIFDQNIDFYKLCVQAFGNSNEYQIVMNVGAKINIKELGELPDNFYVFNNVPINQILPKTDIVIIDAGIKSINEVLCFNNNLPLILIKQDLNEFDYSKLIKKNEAGIVLNDKRLTPEKFRDAVNNYINDKSKYLKGVQNICQSFKEARNQRKEILEKIFG